MHKLWQILIDRRLVLAHVVLTLALAATLFVYDIAKRNIEQNALDEFNSELQLNMATAREGLLRYVYAVRDVASLIENDPALTTDTWEKVMRSLDLHRRLPALRELGYAEKGENGSLPVRFMITRGTNTAHHIGSDLASDAKARETQRQALDSELPLGFGEQDCLLFVPSARGFAFASFGARELWNDLLRSILQSQVEMRLLGPGETPPAELAFRRTISMTTWGFRWRLVATARPSFARTAQLGRPPIFLASGLALTALLSAIAYGQAWRRIRVQQINEELERRITERTSQLQQALAREQELSNLKSQFVSTVSHEFRTPLGIIVSSAGILDNYLDRLTPAERREHLDSIQKSAAHMAELMEGVLLFSRSEADRVEFNPAPIDLLPLCQRVVGEVISATNRRCPIEFSHATVPASVRADESLVRHILSNLLANAVKYSQAGQPVRFEARGNGANVILRVEDHGVGIPATDQERLFSAFHRARNVEHVHGTGLGLFIVKKCVDLHGGEIHIESQEGRGTTVTVTLPLALSK